MLFSISRGSNFLIFTFFWIPAFVWLYLSASWPLQDIFFYLGTSYKIVIVTGCARKSDKAESWRSVRQKLGSDCVCTSFRTYMRSSQTQSRTYMRTPHVSPGFTFEVAKQSRNSSLTNHAYMRTPHVSLRILIVCPTKYYNFCPHPMKALYSYIGGTSVTGWQVEAECLHRIWRMFLLHVDVHILL